MDITTLKNTITLISTPTVGYAYIHYIIKVATTGESTENTTIVETSSSYDLLTDGYYKITEIKLPNIETVGGYYTLNDVVYDPTGAVITIDALLSVDTIGTNLVRVDLNYLLIYFLETYYVNILKGKFLKNICSCNCINAQDRVLIDTLTMGIELIRNLESLLQYNECQRLIEQLSTCSGITNSSCNCYG